MQYFKSNSWSIDEVESDTGLVEIGNAGLCPCMTKQVIDSYLKPILVGETPFDFEFLWQDMHHRAMAFGRKGVAMVAVNAVDIVIQDLIAKALNQPLFRLLGGELNRESRFTPAAFTTSHWIDLRRKPRIRRSKAFER